MTERLEWWPEYNSGPLWWEQNGKSADLAGLGLPDELAERVRVWNSEYDDSLLPFDGPGNQEWLSRGIVLLAEVRKALTGRYRIFVTQPWWGEKDEEFRQPGGRKATE